MIYFIHNKTNRTIKIGCAWNPARRLSTLQISNSHELVLLGSVAGMKRTEKQVHALVYRHCAGNPGDPGAQALCVRGEWFDDRILPFVTELLNCPQAFLHTDKKKPPARTRPADDDLRKCGIALVFDSGETFRECFTLKAATPELALAGLENIANARLSFLAHTARITQLRVPGRPTKQVDLRGAFVTQGCDPREGLSVVVNSRPGNGYQTDEVKLQWLHGVPSELSSDERAWWFLGRVFARPTSQFVAFLDQFAQVLNQNQCVVVTRAPLEVRGLIPRGIGRLPKGELRSRTNQKARGKRRRGTTGEARPKSGIVYFIQDTVTTAVKIGFCLKNPEKRLAALQTGNSNPMHLVGHVPGSETHEKGLHRRFSSFHIQGEWFSNGILADVHGLLKCSSLEEWMKSPDSDLSPSDPD